MIQRIVLFFTFYVGLTVSVAAQQATPSALDSVRLEQQLSLLRSMLLEQDRTLNQLQRELNLLRGENEVLNHELAQLKQQQQKIYLDLDQRLRVLNNNEITTSNTSTTAPATDFTTLDPAPSVSSSPSIPSVATLPNPTPDFSSSNTTLSLPTLPPQLVDLNEKNLYQEGFKQVRTDEFSQAIAIFQHLLTRYPQGEYADNAQYWIAESYYALRQFDAAIQAFNLLIERFPDSAKRPHSLLKIGYAYFEQQDYVSARALLEQVKTAYPNSSTARLAQARLARLAELGF